jgi:hypothetical protein
MRFGGDQEYIVERQPLAGVLVVPVNRHNALLTV